MKKIRYFIALLMAYFMLVTPAIGALTVDNVVMNAIGNRRMITAQVDFDSSYAYGGESFDYTAYGVNHVDSVKFTNQDGYTFEYDYTNKTVKAFAPAPMIVYEEVQTGTAGTSYYEYTLNYPAAYIMNVCSSTANYAMLSADSTASTNQVLVELYESTPGTRAVLSLTPQATIYVTYVTQAWKDVFDNLVVDESHDYTTGGTVLTYSPIAIMYMDSGDNTPFKPLYSSDTAAAGEVAINWDGTLTAQADLSGGKVSYIKKPSSGFLADRFVEEEAVTMSSGTGALTWPVLLWGTAGYFPDSYTTPEDPSTLMLAGDALGSSSEAYLDWFRKTTVLGNLVKTNGTTSTQLRATYIKGNPWEIPNIVPLEVVNGSDLSNVTDVRVEVIGY